MHNFCRTCCNFLQTSASVGQLEHLFPASYGDGYPVCRFFLFSFFPPYYASVGFPSTPHAGGPDTCLRSGFTLTVKLPSSVIISQQSQSRQPFSHVLLLSCAECLIFFSFFLSLAPHSLILITYSMRHELAGSGADRGSSAPLLLDGGLLLSLRQPVRVRQGDGD